MAKCKPRKVDEAELQEYQAIANGEFTTVLRNYGHPIIKQNPEVVEHINDMDTASFNVVSHEQQISANFIRYCIENGLDKRTAMRGIETHETGHHYFPGELYMQLFLQAEACRKFGNEKGPIIYCYYVDVVDNLESLRSGNRKEDIKALYKAMSAKSNSRTDRLMAALYQEISHLDFGVDAAPYIDKLKGPLQKDKDGKEVRRGGLQGIPYFLKGDRAHGVNLIMFGELIKDLIKPETGGQGGEGEGQGEGEGEEDGEGEGEGDGGDDGESKGKGKKKGQGKDGGEGQGEGDGEGGPKGPRKTRNWGDTGGPGDYTNDDIEAALRKIAAHPDLGKHVYDDVRRFVGANKPGFKDPVQPEPSGKGFIGLEGSDLTFNNDCIAYYERASAYFGVYVAKKLRKTNALDAYPEENVPFEAGDPIGRLNRWATPRIIPGISKRFKDGYGDRTDYSYKIPDLFVALDTSGSMPNPRFESDAVLAAFVLARNYHANGANVGIMNFSSDALLLPPGRDLNAFYQAACAWWGGGTVVNIEKVKEMFRRLSLDERVDAEISTEEDYRKMLKNLRPEEQRAIDEYAKEKRLNVRLDKKLSETYQKIDNIIITDGAIWNITDLVKYLNEIGDQARNTIFIIDNPADYKAWSEMAEKGELRNTVVVPVNSPRDLLDVSIGIGANVKRMADTPGDSTYWNPRRVA